uniref:polyketide synthase docking domain-containing protein n=1 Tax=Nocardia wallacei TaxID=480035 RepID=UPI00245560D2
MTTDNDKYVRYLKRTAVELRQLRERNRELESAWCEPLAVVGVGSVYLTRRGRLPPPWRRGPRRLPRRKDPSHSIFHHGHLCPR